MAQKNILTIKTDETIGSISPNIYGHFIEHLGHCIYPGIWVGEDSNIPNVYGLRRGVVEALKDIDPPVLRWPGGCFADSYHWKDGIGPRDERPRRPNLWWGGIEPNEFGTHEFLQFCSTIGAKPYICLNVGSGNPEETVSWVEYCNHTGDSSYSKLRAKNGHPQPYEVRIWGVGNENWGCGGSLDPVYYGWEYRRFATYLRRADPRVRLIACGHTSRDWNLRLMDTLRHHLNLIDDLSIHYYFRSPNFGGDVSFTDEEYLNLLFDIQNLEYQIQQAIDIVDFFSDGRKNIGIVVDEWGAWHPQATLESGLYQQNTLRDAILAAVCLNLFNRYSSKVVMANMAQTLNVLQSLCLTRDEKTIVTPTYHVYNLYKPHMGSKALKVKLHSPTIRETSPGDPTLVPVRRPRPLQALDASASLGNDGKSLFITLANQSLDEDLETEIRIVNGKGAVEGTVRVLNARNVRDLNDFDFPGRVAPVVQSVKTKGNIFHHTAPRHSVSALALTLM